MSGKATCPWGVIGRGIVVLGGEIVKVVFPRVVVRGVVVPAVVVIELSSIYAVYVKPQSHVSVVYFIH